MEAAPALAEGYPRAFGSYVLLTAFAQGGMGEVYLAKTGGIEGIERICVLKKLRPDFGQNQEYVNRFLDEARLVVQLNHANIAHVFDVGRVGSEYYLAMEYVSGVSLKGLMARAFESGAPLAADVALFALCEALEALDYAHRLEHPMTGQALNLVHRDVSPHNVMVSYEGEVKLIDFGLAESELKEEQTESHVVMGKVAYMSPEQARGERVTGRCDQFAAGVMAYELLTHDRFYGEMSNYQIWQVVGRGGFTPRAWGTLDAALQPILSRALHGDPQKRFASCGDFKEALLDWLVARYPRTSRRTLREAIRGLFGGDTEKERTFLQQVASVSAASVRAGHDAGARTQSYSIVRAPGSNPPAPAPGVTLVEPPAAAASSASSTHVIARRGRSSSRGKQGALFAGIALIALGGVAGYLLTRANAGSDEVPMLEVAAPLAAVENGAVEHAAVEHAALENAVKAEPAVEPAAVEPEPAIEPAAVEPEPAVESADVEPEPASKSSRKSAATKRALKRAPERQRVTEDKVQQTEASPAAPERAEPVPEPAAAGSAKADEREAWRTRVLRRLERCPPCAATFLERANLRTLPVDKLSAGVRLSVESCLKQCEQP